LPAKAIYVFDACAVIALLDAEPGGEIVEALLEKDSHRCLLHVLNACEVFYHLYRRVGSKRAARLQAVLGNYGFELDDSLPGPLWRQAGQLKAIWRRVSLADCFALALAVRKKATLVTTDHHELDVIAQSGLCPFRFIR